MPARKPVVLQVVGDADKAQQTGPCVFRSHKLTDKQSLSTELLCLHALIHCSQTAKQLLLLVLEVNKSQVTISSRRTEP
jgi:hypothetical protein